MPELIELASFLAAVILVASFTQNPGPAAYAIGVVAGVIGSRLASKVRQRQSIREMQEWARQMRPLYPED
jgi:hypothetical protein